MIAADGGADRRQSEGKPPAKPKFTRFSKPVHNSLTRAVPVCRELLVQAAERGDNIGSLSASLLRLLDRYGAADVELAVKEALAAGVPHPNAVRLALERRRTARGSPPPVALVLPEHVRRKDTPVRPHRLDSYDQLSKGANDDEQAQS